MNDRVLQRVFAESTPASPNGGGRGPGTRSEPAFDARWSEDASRGPVVDGRRRGRAPGRRRARSTESRSGTGRRTWARDHASTEQASARLVLAQVSLATPSKVPNLRSAGQGVPGAPAQAEGQPAALRPTGETDRHLRSALPGEPPACSGVAGLPMAARAGSCFAERQPRPRCSGTRQGDRPNQPGRVPTHRQCSWQQARTSCHVETTTGVVRRRGPRAPRSVSRRRPWPRPPISAAPSAAPAVDGNSSPIRVLSSSHVAPPWAVGITQFAGPGKYGA